MAQRGSLVVISGFSGVGKGTVVKSLMDHHEGYALSVSATTREPREGEVHGKDYFYCSEQQFQQMILKHELIEYANYCDHFYGTPRKFVEEQLDSGMNVILEIEIQGAQKIREQFPEALLVFIMPPSAQEMMRRLAIRGTESEQVIRERIRRASREAEGIGAYDYIVINDNADVCADQLHSLVRNQKLSVRNCGDFIREITAQINTLANE